MKTFILNLFSLLFFFSYHLLIAQIKMGDRPLEIHPQAIFEIESTDQGVLLPRMSTGERDLAFKTDIPNGLLIFNLTLNHFEFYDSLQNTWSPIQTALPKLKLQDDLLYLNEDNAVDLSPWKDNTDAQQLFLDGSILGLENGGEVDLNALISNSQAQHLSLQGSILVLENGGSVDLSPLFSADQDHQQLSLSNTELILERGGRVDLAPLISTPPAQKIDHFKLVSNTLELSLSSDGEEPHKINLNSLNTDDQQLSLTSNTLTLEDGGQVDLSNFYDNTDAQTISLSIPDTNTLNLKISNGNTITFSNSGSLSFSKTSTHTALLNVAQSPFSIKKKIVSNEQQQWSDSDFVFGSPQLDNDKSTTDDNKRLFFDKSKAAFRAGVAQSDQWDESNRGTYSIAMGRNTIASGYHATAFGLSTQSKAWYSTTMGQGTVAESRAETVLGSYNTTYTPTGGTRDWNPSDRLLVVGNGTGSSAASRTDALVIFKDATASTSGVWSGPGFNKISDQSLKKNIKRIRTKTDQFLQLQAVQFEYKNTPNKTQFGFLAQELEKIYPKLVHELNGKRALKNIDYLGLIPVLVDLVQQQQKEIDALKKAIVK